MPPTACAAITPQMAASRNGRLSGYGIATNPDDPATVDVVGSEDSGYGFPITERACDTSPNSYGDAFAARLNLEPNVLPLGPTGVAGSPGGSSSDTAGLPGNSGGASKGGVSGGGGCADDDYPTVAETGTVGGVGDPINTRTGAYSRELTNLSVPTTAGALVFNRTYDSLFTDLYIRTLVADWTHNLDTRLTFQPGKVWFKAYTPTQYLFYDNGDAHYLGAPGVLATLTRISDTVGVTYTDKFGTRAVHLRCGWEAAHLAGRGQRRRPGWKPAGLCL